MALTDPCDPDQNQASILFVLTADRLAGPVNPVSPNPVRNAEMAATLSRVLGARPGLAMPAFLLRLMPREMADALLLASQRIQPCRLREAGYQFCHPELDGALRHALQSVN